MDQLQSLHHKHHAPSTAASFTTYRFNKILVQSAIISMSVYFPNHSVNTILLMEFKRKELFLEIFPLASPLFGKKAKAPPSVKGLKEG